MKIIDLNYFTDQTKKVFYVFHGNCDSFDMIFITIIRSKINKSNGFLTATSKTWAQTLDLDPEKPGHCKTWTLKDLDPEKPEP